MPVQYESYCIVRASEREIIHELRLVDYLHVQMHEIYTNLNMYDMTSLLIFGRIKHLPHRDAF